VRAKTLEIAATLNLAHTLLPELSDIDRPEDLIHLPITLR
jgi:glycosyltransferase A (GT-A) superfamily protein (DUF2064 family)